VLYVGIALLVSALALLTGTARANTAIIGSSLSASNFSLVDFGPPATVTNYVLPPSETAGSPTNGTVISWSFIGAGGPLTPRVLRSTGTTSLSAAGTGPPQNATTPNAISGPFSLSMPIKKGDYFGVDGASGASLSTAPTAGATSLYFTPALVDGAGELAPTGINSQEDAISAVVRFCLVPSLKGMTGKAARQALQSANCTIGQVIKGKRKSTKRVLSQSVDAGTSIADTQPVDLKISRKRKA